MRRKTNETEVILTWGDSISINTGVEIFDHFLSQMAVHGGFNLEITATGSNEHHIVEDVGICLGQAFLEMKKGRIGYSIVPMDDALVMVVIDFSGRGYSQIEGNNELMSTFLGAFAREGRFNLHVVILRGENEHHIVEAVFKALGRALREGINGETK